MYNDNIINIYLVLNKIKMKIYFIIDNLKLGMTLLIHNYFFTIL